MFNMTKITAKTIIEKHLQSAGITVNGKNPWDIQVHREDFYLRVLQEGALGLGESYMDKWWDCEKLDVFFDRILSARLNQKVQGNAYFSFYFRKLLRRLINFQSKKWAKVVARKHYDLGNALFKAMLDPHMIYSCGYFKNASSLEEAQEAKLELLCQKLQLKPGLHLLDIGCGFGGLAKYAAEKYGVRVTGITISKKQYEFAKEFCKNLPIDIALKDYRNIHGQFDRVVSVGMFEHVGHLNYLTFMQTIHQSLVENGLFLLHTIGINETSPDINEWTLKYIFPNGMLPSIEQIGKTAENLFVMEDWHNFGADYDPTLMAWYHNFVKNFETIQSQYDERFYRMWTYYLLSSAGNFRARESQVWQIVFSKGGIKGGYRAPR